jgi:two-component system cell cycle response regulator
VTLRMRLSLAFFLVVMIPLLVAVGIVARGVPSGLTNAADHRLLAARASVSALLQQTCANATLAAEVVGREAAVGATRTHGLSAAQARRAAQDAVTRNAAAYAVVADEHGKVVASAGHLPPATRPPPHNLGSCSAHRPATAPIVAIADSVAIRADGGAGLGVAAVGTPIDARWVANLAAATGTEVTLVADGHVRVSTEPSDVAQQLLSAADSARTNPASVAGRLAIAEPGPSPQSALVLTVSRPGTSSLVIVLVAVLLISILLATIIGWWLARLTTQPLDELSQAAARVASGDLRTRIDVRSNDEVGRLAMAFNAMTDALRSYVGELESSRDELRRNLARLGNTLSSTHDLGRILAVVLDTAIGSIRAGAGAAYIQPPGRDDLVLRAGTGLEDRAGASRIPVGDGVTGAVAASGEARRGTVGQDGLQLSPLEPVAAHLISVPMQGSNGVLGVLNLYDRIDGRPFDADDLEIIRTFAGQAAVAVDNVILHQEAQRMSVTDALTGLGNYRFFQANLAREVDRAARFGRGLAVLMADLDLFKLVNDIHGHQVGDAVLIEIAARLRAEVREVDVVARYGGEEFVVVLPETDEEGAGHTADRICTAVRQRPFEVAGLRLSVTASVGVAVFPKDGDNPVTLVRAADDALYSAKEAGRDQWRMATSQSSDVSR